MRQLSALLYLLAISFLLIGCQETTTETEVHIRKQLEGILTDYDKFSEKCGEYEVVNIHILETACMYHKVPPARGNPIDDVVHVFAEEGWVPIRHPENLMILSTIKFAIEGATAALEQTKSTCKSRMLIHTEKITESESLSTILRLDCDLKEQGR